MLKQKACGFLIGIPQAFILLFYCQEVLSSNSQKESHDIPRVSFPSSLQQILLNSANYS